MHVIYDVIPEPLLLNLDAMLLWRRPCLRHLCSLDPARCLCPQEKQPHSHWLVYGSVGECTGCISLGLTPRKHLQPAFKYVHWNNVK